MTTITTEALADLGYRRHLPVLKGKGCLALWQKRVEDERGTRYFLNVYEWRMRDIVPEHPGAEITFQAEVQFTTKGEDKRHCDVSLHQSKGMTVAEIESFFERAWTSMGFDHYELHAWTEGEAA